VAKEPISPLTRRSRIPVALAAAFALVVMATSFPLSTLLSQHHQLSAAAAQLHQVQRSNRSLAEVNQQLNSSAEIDRMARQDYQLESPGQTLYDVLPPAGQAGSATPGTVPKGGPTSGDPGNEPLVNPADAPNMSPDPGLPRATTVASGSGVAAAAARAGAHGSSGGVSGAAAPEGSFWSRVTDTLEFWK
jgi:cell division protein FtsB